MGVVSTSSEGAVEGGFHPLRRVAKGLKSLRRVAPEGSAKLKKTGYFTAVKPPKAVYLT